MASGGISMVRLLLSAALGAGLAAFPAAAQDAAQLAEDCDALLREAHQRDYADTDLSVCETAISSNPGNQGIVRSTGWAYKEQGKISRALELLEGLANLGDVEAIEILGFMYLKGDGVPEDDEKALAWFHIAADAGGSHAQIALGMMHLNGWGVPESPENAVRWFRLAAEQGSANALGVPGAMYAQGAGVEQDYDVAFELTQRAAKMGDASAQNNLGILYEEGLGVEKDIGKALEWFYRATEQGHEDAAANVRRLGGNL